MKQQVEKVETTKITSTQTHGSVAKTIVRVLTTEKVTNRDMLGKRVFEIFKVEYNGRHKRGEVRLERIKQQIGALFGCFNNWKSTGKARTGWWDKFKILETDDSIKLVKREQKKEAKKE